MTTPQHLSDRYELGEILGFGGMSEVHLARDVRLHRDVAVKVLRADLARDPSFYLRFRREAQNAAALNHPAIVAVYDTGEAETATGPLPFIVMEYVDGITLRDIIQNDGPIPPLKAIEIIADACQALNFSHQHGIIHRDVKPANIMLSHTGAVKVMDFGIARAISDSGVSVTQTSAVIGTAQYLSPEQARGESVDARSDVYSLGCVLYEILTGEPPFVGDSPVAVAYQHVREAPVPPSQKHEAVTADLDAVVLKALAKNPENRYQTAAEMRADMVRVHNGEAPEAPKVLTDAERTSLMSGPARPQQIPPRLAEASYAGTQRSSRASVTRWLIAVAVLAVLTIAVTVGINVIPGLFKPPQVQVPDVAGQSSANAIATLQKLGFHVTTPQLQFDTSVPSGNVIRTEPTPNETVDRGSDVTIYVSAGAGERVVPDVTNLSYEDAARKLEAAGFSKVTRAEEKSTPEQKDKVVRTNPPANGPALINYEVTVYVGSGPEAKDLPDLRGQPADSAEQTLRQLGFTTVIRTMVDSTKPAGEVIGMNPPAGPQVRLDQLIDLQVSRGNQFVMPNVIGQFWDDLLPLLRGRYGWTGNLNKGPDVQGDSSQHNKVITQSPAPGVGVNRDADITLAFGA